MTAAKPSSFRSSSDAPAMAGEIDTTTGSSTRAPNRPRPRSTACLGWAER
jgi:hypothetical protein